MSARDKKVACRGKAQHEHQGSDVAMHNQTFNEFLQTAAYITNSQAVLRGLQKVLSKTLRLLLGGERDV